MESLRVGTQILFWVLGDSTDLCQREFGFGIKELC